MKRTIIYALIIVSVLTIVVGLYLSRTSISNSSKNPWPGDIDYMVKTLEEKDINLCKKIDRSLFQSQLADLKNQSYHLSSSEVTLQLSQILAGLNDAHTMVIMDNSQSNVYPIGVSWFADNLYVTYADKKYENLLGYKLVKINDTPVEEIVKKVNTLISHENEYWLKVQNESYLMKPEILKYFNVTNADETVFTFSSSGSEDININISPADVRTINYVYLSSMAKDKPLCQKQNTYYWYEYLPQDRILYFQYNICSDKQQLKQMYPNDTRVDALPELNTIFDEMLKIVSDKKVDKFVMDLRHNIGGDSQIGTSFVYELSKAIINSGTKVYGLIGNLTFSSGVWNALDLHSMTNAVLIGEPTGGSPNSYGNVELMELPNSKLKIQYSTKQFNLSYKYKNTVTPDYFVEPAIEQFKNGMDPVYEEVKKH